MKEYHIDKIFKSRWGKKMLDWYAINKRDLPWRRNENKNFYDEKIDTARFYFDKVLPRAEQHYKSAISGSSNIMNFKFN